ncbi:MAG TPA: glycosyltransferase family A protein [Gemmatimonadota bacterium]|nr:glycosyltransferase family A protein [Gemmatimonadota bacterium]
MRFTLRQKLGAVLIDWPRYEWNLRELALPGRPSGHWTRIANRDDELLAAPRGNGVDRVGRWTSRLHGCAVFPSLGRRLMRRSLAEWPIELSPELAGSETEEPDITFVIGHRGIDRIPHLLTTLRSIAAQSDARIECVVVEQSERAEAGALLPDWVRYLHTPPPVAALPYVRAWALNTGARLARGRLLVFHDGDMLMPRRYAAELLTAHGLGFEVINLKRFVFYLAEETKAALLDGVPAESGKLDAVVQNLQAGGSVAVDREAFFELGGFDEMFVGWGGEDDEFWDRARTRRLWPWGHLPCVHLWHRAQPEKVRRERSTAARLEDRLRVPAETRIRELSTRHFGIPAGPASSPSPSRMDSP